MPQYFKDIVITASQDGYYLSYRNQDFLIPIMGNHQKSNLLLCLESIYQYFHSHKKNSNKDIEKKIKKGLSGMQKFQNITNRFTFIQKKPFFIWNDSYNANISSYQQAIFFVREYVNKYYSKNKVIGIFGSMEELGNQTSKLHFLLGKIAKKANISNMIFISNNNQAKKYFYKGYYSKKQKNKCTIINDSDAILQDTIKKIFPIIKRNDHILVKGSRLLKLERVIEFLQEKQKNIL